MQRILASCVFLFVSLWVLAPAFPEDTAELQRIEAEM